MGLFKDLSGQKFNMLTVIKLHGKKNNVYYYECECDCGGNKIIRGVCLTNGHTKSCGCLHVGSYIHGKSNRSPEYHSWVAMKSRCNNPNQRSFKNYGARGIKVCDEWTRSFETFLRDMGNRPSNHSLDRIDVNKGYYKSNCQWSDNAKQSINKANSIFITFNGQTRHLSEWAKKIGLKRRTLYKRYVVDGWSAEKSIQTPLEVHQKLTQP